MKPVVLCILDGWGETPESQHNAIKLARTGNWDFFLKNFPHTILDASAGAVGLPEGQMGNSEVGHMTIGSGRTIYQDLPRIDQAIKDGSFEHNTQLTAFIERLKNSGTGVCHILGLLSPGGVHSHQKHLAALCAILSKRGIKAHVHAFLDGRDTPPQSALSYLEEFLNEIKGYSGVSLSSLGGRYFGMDRDKRWDRVQKAYDALVMAKGSIFEDPLTYITQCYAQGITDEFIPPAVAKDFSGIKDGDGLIEGNFRADRVRQLLTALLIPDFSEFQRERVPKFSAVTGMTHYSDQLSAAMSTLFPPQKVVNSIGELVEQAGFRQLRIAETEKYAHVTFFFNGGEEKKFSHEDRILIPSPQVATYDLRPEMSAVELTDKLVQAINQGTYSFVVVNYANTDMVGHSGNLEATVKAVETIDQCLGRLYEAVKSQGGLLAITADHGNAETMQDPVTKEKHTAHTTNPVPFILVGQALEGMQLRLGGGLADVAPTLLDFLQLQQPMDMTGSTLLEANNKDWTALEQSSSH